MPIRQRGRLAKNVSTLARASRFLSTTRPRSSMPCTWNTFFAMSRPW
jgi:hypothetical protein